MPRYIPKIKLSSSADFLPDTDVVSVEVQSEIAKYSVTPRLLKQVEIVESTSAFDRLMLVEEYSISGKEVIRYSLRAEKISKDPVGTILGEGSTIPKQASVSSAAYTPSTAKTAILHSLEKEILRKAIDSFVTAGKLVAVVDIFERNQAVAIQVEGEHPIVHSVVLQYNQSANQVFVIDPNNFLYSSHLENDDFSKELQNDGMPLIKTLHKKLQIYTPNKTVGTSYSFDKFRDCSDAAVKLALKLLSSPLASLDMGCIKSNPAIIFIANSTELDAEYLSAGNLAPIRIKQASSELCQEVFNKLQKEIGNKIDMLQESKPDLSLALETTYKTILRTAAKHTELISQLNKLDEEYRGHIEAMLKQSHEDIMPIEEALTNEVAVLGDEFYDYR